MTTGQANHPAAAQTVTEQTEVQHARKALHCLYIAVPEEVARDVNQACDAAFAALQQENESIRRVLLKLMNKSYHDADCPVCPAVAAGMEPCACGYSDAWAEATKVMEGGNG